MTTSQARSFEGKPSSFFAFCLNEKDFPTKLRIPKAFEEDYTDFLLQQNLQLKTNGSDRCWDVKIKHIDDKFFILDGWSDLVKDYNLLDMMFLVFRIVASSTFHVDVYGHDSCLQLLPEPTPTPGDEGETSLRFVKELKEYNVRGQRMELPKEFAERTGIATSSLVMLENESGRQWPAAITDRNVGMYSITGGWLAFLIGNNLQVGNIILFEFVPDSNSAVKVSVVEQEAGIELIAQARRGGFLGS